MTDKPITLQLVRDLRRHLTDGETLKASVTLDQLDTAIDRALNATAQGMVPEGFWLAPLEWTQKMERAWCNVDTFEGGWEAIRAAAPTAPIPAVDAVAGEPVASDMDDDGGSSLWCERCRGTGLIPISPRAGSETTASAADRCEHGIRSPHECRECADAQYDAWMKSADREHAQLKIEGAHDRGMDDARSGIQEVTAGFEDLPFDGCPESWGAKPFARIRWYHYSGDSSVGEPDQSGWTLTEDQSGTVVGDLAASATASASVQGVMGAEVAAADKTVEVLWRTLKEAVGMIDNLRYSQAGDGAHEDTFDVFQRIYRDQLNLVLTAVATPMLPDEIRLSVERYEWLRAHSYGSGNDFLFGSGCIQTMPWLLDMAIDAQRKLTAATPAAPSQGAGTGEKRG